MSDVSRPIAILGGTGPAGMGVALRWARAGETIIIGSRDAHRAQEAADGIKEIIGDGARVSGMENSAACAATDLLVLTVPFEAQAALLKQLKPAIRPGGILIDATVALAASVGGRASRTLGVWQGSSAQQAAELVPKGVSVVAAFHNLSAESTKRRRSSRLRRNRLQQRRRMPRNSRGLSPRKFPEYAPSTAANSKTPASSSRSLPCSSASTSATKATAASASPDCRRRLTSRLLYRSILRTNTSTRTESAAVYRWLS